MRFLPAVLLFVMLACAAAWLFTGSDRAGGMVPALVVLYIIAVSRAHRLTRTPHQDRSAVP